jgi:hypothetical protein
MLRSRPTSSFDEDRRCPGIHRTLALRHYSFETRARPPARQRCFARHGTRGTTAGIKSLVTAPSAASVEQTEWASASLTRDPRSGTTRRCRFARGPSLRDCSVRLLITPLIPAAVAAIGRTTLSNRLGLNYQPFTSFVSSPLNLAPHRNSGRGRIRFEPLQCAGRLSSAPAVRRFPRLPGCQVQLCVTPPSGAGNLPSTGCQNPVARGIDAVLHCRRVTRRVVLQRGKVALWIAHGRLPRPLPLGCRSYCGSKTKRLRSSASLHAPDKNRTCARGLGSSRPCRRSPCS